MASPAKQNRVAIELAVECLRRSSFAHVHANRSQGTFPHAHITATRGGESFFIGVRSRKEIGADGDYNRSYNIVETAEDMREGRAIATKRNEVPAFVTIALRPEEGTYSAFFGRLQSVSFKRSIPMLLGDRRTYEELCPFTYDPRVAELGH
jgi:hypothetical protein